ncbi:MAG: monovalent cation/H+ antiporter subunit D [Roseateles sp.]|uniref:monovalent cation/H+ antiporter subunit D n=1 Tax=Roseateles sp. TaxID=1971397 RepID=UPI00403703C1
MSSVIAAHLPVLPVVLPAAAAVLLLVLGDAGLQRARSVALASAALMALVACMLLLRADTGALTVYRLGDWPAPFGIVLVVDRLAALMLLLTACTALPVLLYASAGWDGRGRHFHALFQFQLMGLNGAFITGDLFNLFVFFEVLLVASYALMLHGQGRERLRVGLHYVVLNLAASALFLIGVALVYAMTGTLNLADLALRVPAATGSEALVLQAGGLILLVVFGFKAALMPLSMWLPATYAAASAPVAALFAIMTKVGVYAILRVHGVVFGGDQSAAVLDVQSLLLPLALLTGVVAVLGALAAQTLPRLLAWLTVVSVGTVLTALGVGGAAAWSAALYYLAQSTLVTAGLFLLAELISAQRGETGGRLDSAPAVAQPQLLGILLLLGGAAVAGLPPLPGFVGKLMLLQASAGHAWVATVWAVVLAVGFCTLLALARAGAVLFWQVQSPLPAAPLAPAAGARPQQLLAALVPLALVFAMSIFAAPLQRYADATALQLGDRGAYARAVLGESNGQPINSTRPYRVVPAGGRP